jgi:hypothetical protein
MLNLIPIEKIKAKIYLIRGLKVMLDRDLAGLYRVDTKRLNEQVKRNIKRFPNDFMFQLTQKEFNVLMSQFATSKPGGTRKLPFAFTEHGIAMLSSVLKSEQAILVNIAIIRTFIKLRDFAFSYKSLADKIIELEAQYKSQNKKITEIFVALHLLAKKEEENEEEKDGEIGFK